MLTVKQCAESIGVSDSLVYEWISEGALPHYRFGRKGRRGKVMVDEQEWQAFLAACRQEAKAQEEAFVLKHIKRNG